MFKKIVTLFFLFNLCVSGAIADMSESPFSVSLSRMEREWLHREFNQDDDDVRISRLEEKVFGTIHDIDKNLRYKQLREAFNAKKNMTSYHQPNYLYGVPTSIPMNVDDLLGY